MHCFHVASSKFLSDSMYDKGALLINDRLAMHPPGRRVILRIRSRCICKSVLHIVMERSCAVSAAVTENTYMYRVARQNPSPAKREGVAHCRQAQDKPPNPDRLVDRAVYTGNR